MSEHMVKGGLWFPAVTVEPHSEEKLCVQIKEQPFKPRRFVRSWLPGQSAPDSSVDYEILSIRIGVKEQIATNLAFVLLASVLEAHQYEIDFDTVRAMEIVEMRVRNPSDVSITIAPLFRGWVYE